MDAADSTSGGNLASADMEVDSRSTENTTPGPESEKEPVASPPKENVKECPKFLDLAFAMDCTGSMGSYIHSAQQNIRNIVEQIVSEEKADVRLALVQYRDHPPQDNSFITHVDDFTPSVRSMKQWLDGCKASGGGDQAEAVADALHQVLKLSWREEATKVCVFIADAPPHGIGCGGDAFPNGCPNGLDPMEVTNELAAKHISLYMVGCEPSIVPFRDFFMGLAHLTGGQYVPLGSAKLLAKVITGGVQEEISLQNLMQEVNQEVIDEFGAGADEIEEEALTKRVHAKLKDKGTKAKKLQRNNAELPEASVQAQQMSKCVNLSDYRSKHSLSSGDSHMMSAAPSRSSGGVGGFMSRLFGSRSSASPSSSPMPMAGAAPSRRARNHAPPASSAYPMGEAAPVNMLGSAMPAMDMATESDDYGCVEDEVSEAQVQRMVQKSVWSNNLKERYKKKF